MFRPIVEFINTDLSQSITLAIEDLILECDEDHGGTIANPLAKKIFATVTASQPYGTIDLMCWAEMLGFTCPITNRSIPPFAIYYRMVLVKNGIYNIVQ